MTQGEYFPHDGLLVSAAPLPTFVELRKALHAGELSAMDYIEACLRLPEPLNPVTGKPLTLEELGA